MGAGSLGAAGFAEEVCLLRAMLADAGRDPASFPIGKRVYLAIDRDRGRAARRLAEWFGAFDGKLEMAEQVACGVTSRPASTGSARSSRPARVC
jgi:hypothetical protein